MHVCVRLICLSFLPLSASVKFLISLGIQQRHSKSKKIYIRDLPKREAADKGLHSRSPKNRDKHKVKIRKVLR